MPTDTTEKGLESLIVDSLVNESGYVALQDEDAEIGPVPTSGGGHIPEPELDRLSNILRTFNEQFGNIDWKDQDKIRQVIAEEIPVKVAADKAYQNAMKHSDKQNARIARQGLATSHRGSADRPHRVVQAVQRQPGGQEMAHGYDILGDVQSAATLERLETESACRTRVQGREDAWVPGTPYLIG